MNIRMNDRMSALYYPGDHQALSSRLEDLLSGGFTSREQCIFLKKLFETSGNPNPEMFMDDIGYECCVNHFHFKDGTERELVSTAVEFFRRARTEWRHSGLSGELQFIISIKDDECTIRFHLMREGLQWLVDDLNVYEDTAILIIDTVPQQDEVVS